MSRKPKPGRPAKRTAKRSSTPTFSWDRSLALSALLCLIVGVVYAIRSQGVYQDDDLDHYFTALRVWRQPAYLLDSWAMPLLTTVLAVPSKLFGYRGVELATVAASAAGAVAVGWSARRLGLPAAWLGVVLCFFQPLALELSYSGLAEPWAALILSLSLAAWYGDRKPLALMLAGLLPLVRAEGLALLLLFLVVSWKHTGWRHRLWSLAPFLVWMGLSGWVFGDLLYPLRSGGRPLNTLGALHYARNWIVIAGSVTLFGFVWGLAAGLRRRPPTEDARESGARFPLFAATIVILHLILLTLVAWDAFPVGRSIGFLRHALVIAPPLALVATWGFHHWAGAARSPAPGWVPVAAVVAWTALVAAWMSHNLHAHSIVEDYHLIRRWVTSAVLTLVGMFWLRPPGVRVRNAAWAGVGLTLVLMTLAYVPPLQPTPEHEAIITAVQYLEDNDYYAVRSVPGYGVVHTNHPWFAFVSGRERWDNPTTPALTMHNLDRAPAGSIVIWENHYGDRLYGDVDLEFLRQDPRFFRLLELSATPFRLVMFQRR